MTNNFARSVSHEAGPNTTPSIKHFWQSRHSTFHPLTIAAAKKKENSPLSYEKCHQEKGSLE